MELILPDYSLVIQAIIFFAALFIIKIFILDPISEILKGRGERIEGAEQETISLEEKSAQLDLSYREKIKAARSEAQQERASKRQEALSEERKILDKGRGEAQEILKGIRLEIQKESAEAREQLQKEAGALSRLLTEKLLGRPVQ